MFFCSLLRFSDTGPVLHSVEFISEEPPEKLPTHFPDAISVVIILPLKTWRVGGLEMVALVLKGFKVLVRVPTCKWHNVSCPFIGDEALSVTLLKRSSQTSGRLTQQNANIGTTDLVSLKCHISLKTDVSLKYSRGRTFYERHECTSIPPSKHNFDVMYLHDMNSNMSVNLYVCCFSGMLSQRWMSRTDPYTPSKFAM